MSYTVLARRFRSTSFDELVGQEPIARTLRNAIEAGRTAHAYLFCGTRGVGKTSLARIFAKALNVSDDLTEAGAIGEAILRGDDLDVIEIDGASNRGVQEARDLIAGAGLSPSRCPYKIYIIDEVHMLTKEAFNALLKTMEEPPAHVKFILCTTDPHKVPATIQSRCQRFDFRPIPSALIAQQLARILETEGIEAEESVVQQVARLGHGSMRDALSLLDRLIASGERTLTAASVEGMLGLPEASLVEALVTAVVDRAPAAALEAGAALLRRGSSVDQILELLAERFRDLMVARACGGETDLLELPEEARQRVAEQAERFELPTLVYLVAVCDAVGRNARGSVTARAMLDAALVRMALCDDLADAARLLASDAAGTSGGRPGGRAAAAPAGAGKKKAGVEPPRVSAPAASPAPALAPPSPPATAPSVVEVKQGETVARDPSTDEPPSGEELWRRVLDAAAGNAGDEARVSQLAFRSFDGRTLRLGVARAGERRARFLGTQADRMAALVKRVTGRAVRVEIDVPEREAPEPRAGGDDVDTVRRLPVVQQAMEIFDAMVTEVTDDGPRGASRPASSEGGTNE